MTPILLGAALVLLGILAFIPGRRFAREYLKRRKREAHQRELTYYREWKIGKPFEPDSNTKKTTRRR